MKKAVITTERVSLGVEKLNGGTQRSRKYPMASRAGRPASRFKVKAERRGEIIRQSKLIVVKVAFSSSAKSFLGFALNVAGGPCR